MKYLWDEQTSERAAHSWAVLVADSGDEAVHIYDLGAGGTLDDDIPALCLESGVEALVTLNVRDFGAKAYYYEALLDSGLHVIVVRPGKAKPDANTQMALVSHHTTYIQRHLATAPSPALVKVTFSAAKLRTLDELVAETSGDMK